MECTQTVGRLEGLVWADASAQEWLGYNDPEYLAQRYGVAQCPVVEKLGKALAGPAENTVTR